MNNRPQFAGISNNGFTLLELLLVLVLLLLLFGAAVFEFNSMGRGVSLSEGADRMESLFRFLAANPNVPAGRFESGLLQRMRFSLLK